MSTPRASEILRKTAEKHGLPAELLKLLASRERSPRRKGPRGINVRFREALQHEVEGRGIQALRHGSLGVDSVERFTLKALHLENFGPFRETTIPFETTAERPICLIEAKNGRGKSHVIRAVLYLLGVDKAPQSRFKYPGRILHRGVPRHDPTLRVHLLVESDVAGRIELRRHVRFKLQRGDARKVSDARHVLFLDSAGSEGGDLHGVDAERWISERFPPEIIEYFVFDAENSPVSDLSGELGESVPTMQGPVEQVLGISVLRNAAARCRGNHVMGYYIEQKRRVDTDATPTSIQRGIVEREEQREALADERSNLLDELRVVGSERERAQRDLQRLEQTAEQLDSTDHSAIEQETARLEGEREQLRDRLARRVQRDLPLRLLAPTLRRLAAERAPLNASQEWLKGARFALNRLASQVERGALPWQEQRGIPSDELLQRLNAVVGIPARTHTEEPGTFDPERWHVASQQSRGLAAPLHDLQRTERRLHDLQQQQRDLPPPGDTRQLLEEYDQAKERAHQVATQQAEIEARLEALEDEITDLDEEIARLKEELPDVRWRRRQARRFGKLIKLCRALGRAFDEAADALRKEKLGAIEQHASSLLRQITNKAGLYHRIAFDKGSCRFQLLDPGGKEVPPDRSTGERTVLALAIVHGLRQVSGTRLPLIIEAPLRPLDEAHELNVVRHHLARLGEHTVLMEVPGRFHRGLLSELEQRIGQRLALIRESAGATIIEERA